MKKLFLGTASCILLLTSCGSLKQTSIIPQAINTVHSATFNELNLNREDYTILNTITADALVYYTDLRNKINIQEANNEFEIEHALNGGNIVNTKYRGVLRMGYLANDYQSQNPVKLTSPSDIARGFAIYRLINMAQLEGADGIIEPTISTNIEQQGKSVAFRTTVSAKIVKLKADR